MGFDFAKLRFNKSTMPTGELHPEPKPVPFPEIIGERLGDDMVIELWEERAAVQHTENAEFIGWHEAKGSSPELLRRECELLAAADLSMQLGSYVESIIRPRLTRLNAALESDGLLRWNSESKKLAG